MHTLCIYVENVLLLKLLADPYKSRYNSIDAKHGHYLVSYQCQHGHKLENYQCHTWALSHQLSMSTQTQARKLSMPYMGTNSSVINVNTDKCS